jgi:NAD+ kinase
LRFALHVRGGRPATRDFADRLGEEIGANGGALIEEGGSSPDMVIAVGGDGTMLGAVQSAVDWDVPVLGFNLGTLGFLTEAEPEDLAEVVKRLTSGDFDVEERLTVAASIRGVEAVGVNDVVVEKIDSTRLVSLEVVIDGTKFATYRADGLIIATPTGSTAYSFSAGGPVVDPQVEAFVLTPVASHSLFDRPLVLPAESEILVTVHRDRQVRVNVDKTDLGQMGEGETVRIVRGERPARFVTFGTTTFAGLVRQKFGLE